MEYCLKCFKRMCRCGKPRVEIDYYIYPAIYELNRKGYRTAACCSGHEYSDQLTASVSFVSEIEEDMNLIYWQFASYNYRGAHEKRNCLCVKTEFAKKFKKKRTNKLELIREINKELYRWAKTLPTRDAPAYQKVDFPDSYFEKEVVCDDLIDIQRPWILFAKSAEGNRYIATDFLSEIDCTGPLTEFIVNRSGRIKRFCEQDYLSYRTHVGSSSPLKDKIEFDVSGDYRHLSLGYEPYVMIERLLIGESSWYLSYARTDIALEYGDTADYATIDDYSDDYDLDDFFYRHPYKLAGNAQNAPYIENLFDDDDIEDFWDEYPDKTEIDLFSRLFNRMCRMKINICVFSAENINIIFSDRTDFSLLMTKEHNVIAFGEADYNYLDFPRVHVEKKEMFIYANGRLLMRKEVE